MASVGDVGVALVAPSAVADVPRSVGRIEAAAVGAFAGVPFLLLPGLLAGGAVADGPVEDHRHLPGGPAQCPLEVGGVEAVMLLRRKRILAGAEVELTG